MYYQTQHQRPLVGGYLSRRPEYALQAYRNTPGLACLLFNDSYPCDRELMLEALESLGVTDIMLSPQNSRNALLEGYGFRRHYADPFTIVWGLPLEMVREKL